MKKTAQAALFSGIFVGLVNYATVFPNTLTNYIATAGSYLGMLGMLIWFIYPAVSAREVLKSGKHGKLKPLVFSFTGIFLGFLAILFFIIFGFSGSPSDRDLFVWSGFILGFFSLAGVLLFSLYSYVTKDRLPFRINFHFVLAVVFIAIFIPASMATNEISSSFVDTEKTGGSPFSYSKIEACQTALRSLCQSGGADIVETPGVCIKDSNESELIDMDGLTVQMLQQKGIELGIDTTRCNVE